LNRLGGEGHDAVYHLSIPVFGQLRKSLGDGPWYLRVGVMGHYFPAWDEDGFFRAGEEEPGVVVETEGGEFSLGLTFGLDYVR